MSLWVFWKGQRAGDVMLADFLEHFAEAMTEEVKVVGNLGKVCGKRAFCRCLREFGFGHF